jgi:hypothetical protein
MKSRKTSTTGSIPVVDGRAEWGDTLPMDAQIDDLKEKNAEFPIALPSNEDLYELYDGKYLAIYQDQIVGISDSFDEIYEMAEKNIPSDSMGMIKFIKKGVFIYGLTI